MNTIAKQHPAARDRIFEGNLKTYLSQFFGGVIPPEAMEINSWDELRGYLSSFTTLTMPEQGGTIDHRVYGFEKDQILKIIFKKIIY